MRLGRMLAEAEGVAPPRSEQPKPARESNKSSQRTVIESLGNQVRTRLIDNVSAQLVESDVSQEDLRRRVSDELSQLIEADNLPLTQDERQQMVSAVTGDIMGYGPLEPLLEDPLISEVMVNGTDGIYVERAGRIVQTDVRFRNEARLREVINRIVSSVGRRIDESSPMCDARLADGSRVNAVIPPLAVDGSSLTIRKFQSKGLNAADLVSKGSITQPALDTLRLMVEARLNILVSGGTGTGKTTFLNMLSSFIPPGERIVTIEDAVELRLQQDHVIRLECRPPNIEGRGEITIRDLVKNSLRMRPDRVVIGECRGAEALDMLQAMNTGHDGSLTTLHANTPRDALSRIETMVMFAGFELPTRAIREQMASAVDLIVQLERLRDGRRVVTAITEVVGMESDLITLNDIFLLDQTDTSNGPPMIEPTGVRPRSEDRLAKYGLKLDLSWFEPTNRR